MKLLLYTIIIFFFLSSCNQYSRVLPTKELNDYLFHDGNRYIIFAMSKWESGRHILYQIPNDPSNMMVRKISFFYFNKNYPLDSLEITEFKLLPTEISETIGHARKVLKYSEIFSKVKGPENIFVSGGTSFSIATSNKIFNSEGLCTTPQIREASQEYVLACCNLQGQIYELFKIFDKNEADYCDWLPCVKR